MKKMLIKQFTCWYSWSCDVCQSNRTCFFSLFFIL